MFSKSVFKKQRLGNSIRGVISTAALSIAVSPFAYSAQLEEVVVTAQKREQSLQDVPISVSAMSGDKIQNKGFTKLEDISASIPTLHVGEAQITSQVFIRGIGSGVNAGFEQSVGTYVDGIYYGRGRQSRGTLFDVERVEVLKGPQGTLFGKNTIAGALNITTAGPTDEVEGFISGLYEFEHEETILEGVISGPLSDTLSARLSLRWSEMDDGWMDNRWKNRGEPASETKFARVGLRWNPTDTLEVLGKVTINKFEQQGRNSELTDPNGKYPGAPFVGNMAQLLVPFGETGRRDGKRTVGGSSGTLFDRDESDNDMETYAVTVNYDIGDHVLTLVTGYTEYDMFDAQDNDVTPLDILAMQTDEEYEQFSQEIRLTSPGGEVLDYIVGFYYQTDELDTTQFINANLLDIVGLPPAGPPIFSGRWANMNQETESLAVFAQLTWNISDTLRTTLGLRYSEDEKDAEQELRLTEFNSPNSLLATLMPPLSGIAPGFAQVGIWGGNLGTFEHTIDATRKEEKFTPSLNVQWDANEDVMLYASVGTGYKGGGFDAYFGRASGSFTSSPDGFEFEEEEVLAYELGAKMSLLDGAAELNVAIFRNEFDDVQVSTFDGGLSLRVGNAAETVVEGIELDGRWAISDSLTLSGSVAYIDAYYESFENAQCYFGQPASECVLNPATGLPGQDMSDKDLQYSPDLAAHLTIEHVLPLSDNLELTTVLDLDYSDEYAIAADLDPRSIQDSFTKVDFRIGISDVDGTWEVAFIGKNLSDEDTSTWANDTPLAGGGFYHHIDRLRSYAIQGRYNF